MAFLTATLNRSVAQTPNTWIQKANFGSSARGSSVSFTIGNKGYLGTGGGQVGGWDGSG